MNDTKQKRLDLLEKTFSENPELLESKKKIGFLLISIFAAMIISSIGGIFYYIANEMQIVYYFLYGFSLGNR